MSILPACIKIFSLASQNWMHLHGHTKGLYDTRYKVWYASVIYLHHQRRESFKACPRIPSAHPGQGEQIRPGMLIRLIAVVIPIKSVSSGPSMTSLLKPPGYQSSIPYMVVLLKPGSVPIVKQPFVCLEPENKLGGGPVSPARPSWRSQPQGYQITLGLRNPSLSCFQRESIKMLFVSERWYISPLALLSLNSRQQRKKRLGETSEPSTSTSR